MVNSLIRISKIAEIDLMHSDGTPQYALIESVSNFSFSYLEENFRLEIPFKLLMKYQSFYLLWCCFQNAPSIFIHNVDAFQIDDQNRLR